MNYFIGHVTCTTLLVLHVTHTLAYIALRVSETANPIIYLYGTHDLRKHLNEIFHRAMPARLWPETSTSSTHLLVSSKA